MSGADFRITINVGNNTQAENGNGSRNIADDPLRMPPIIAGHLLDLVFVIIILLKLEEILDWNWAAVFAPLWGTDVCFMFIKIVEVKRSASALARHSGDGVGDKLGAILIPAFGMLEHAAVAVTKILLVMFLEDQGGVSKYPLTLLFLPIWASVTSSSFIRCCLPSPAQRQNRTAQPAALHRCSALVAGTFHFLSRALQPLLITTKIDNFLSGDWWSVFTPAWILLCVMLCISVIVGNTAPLISRHQLEATEVRILLVRMMFLCSLVTFTVAIFGFMFLYNLCRKLEGGRDTASITQILIPVIILYSLIMVFLPMLILASQRYHRATQRLVELNLAAAAQQSLEGGGGGQGMRRPEREVGPLLPDRTLLLYQEGSTLFKRVTERWVKDTEMQRLGGQDPDAAGAGVAPPVCKPEAQPAASDLETGHHQEQQEQEQQEQEQQEHSVSSSPPTEHLASSTTPPPRGETSCLVCWNARSNAVLLECGHSGLCFPCAQALAQRYPQQCPMCRQNIVQILRIEPEIAGTSGQTRVFRSEEVMSIAEP